jgi:hypothetical protein
MYYYPYFLHFMNLFSFNHYNTLDTSSFELNKAKSIDLWSISRSVGHYNTREYIASYNYYTKNYKFDGKQYVSYSEVVNKALQMSF